MKRVLRTIAVNLAGFVLATLAFLAIFAALWLLQYWLAAECALEAMRR